MHLIKRLFKKKEKKQIKPVIKDSPIKKKALTKLNEAVKKKDDDLFMERLKEFFSEYYNIKNEYTFEELQKILNHKKMTEHNRRKLKKTLKELDETYYGSEKLDKKTLKTFNLELKELIKQL